VGATFTSTVYPTTVTGLRMRLQQAGQVSVTPPPPPRSGAPPPTPCNGRTGSESSKWHFHQLACWKHSDEVRRCAPPQPSRRHSSRLKCCRPMTDFGKPLGSEDYAGTLTRLHLASIKVIGIIPKPSGRIPSPRNVSTIVLQVNLGHGSLDLVLIRLMEGRGGTCDIWTRRVLQNHETLLDC
jgi:hypothetical protein